MIYCNLTGEVAKTYQEYLVTDHWKKKKYAIKRQTRNECSTCKSRHNLDVHHLTYKNIGNESMKDLMLLCRTCHYDYHKRGYEALSTLFDIKKDIRKKDIKRNKEGVRISRERYKEDTNILEVIKKIKNDYPKTKLEFAWLIKRKNSTGKLNGFYINLNNDVTEIKVYDNNKTFLKSYEISSLDPISLD